MLGAKGLNVSDERTSEMEINMPTDADLARLLKDPSLSNWLRDALLAALTRDPIDAANDAGLLSLVLEKRADALLGSPVSSHKVSLSADDYEFFSVLGAGNVELGAERAAQMARGNLIAAGARSVEAMH